MAHRAQKHIEYIQKWLEDHDVHTVEASEEMKKLLKKGLGRVFVEGIILSHVADINIFEEMEYILKNKDEEIARIVDELNELEVDESGDVTLDGLISQETEKE